MRHTFLKFVMTVMLTAAVLAVTAPAARAAAPAGQTALIRAAHFSPDTPGVDVYLTGFAGGQTRLWVPNAVYGGVSPYQRVPAGLYVVAMRPHGAPATSKAVISWNLNVQAGQVYTTAAVGTSSHLKSIVLHDDLTLPPAGKGRIRLVQAASRAPQADVAAVNGPTVATAAPFATTTGYTTVPAGTWSLQAHAVSMPTVLADARVSIAARSVTSVLLLDAPSGGITIRSVLDAAGSAVMPVGAVPAGGGAMAPNGPAPNGPAPSLGGSSLGGSSLNEPAMLIGFFLLLAVAAVAAFAAVPALAALPGLKALKAPRRSGAARTSR
jgi:hypothetical protein